MTRSTFTCRRCRVVIAEVKQSSRILHPRPGAVIMFIDYVSGTTAFQCPGCGATMICRGGRIDATPGKEASVSSIDTRPGRRQRYHQTLDAYADDAILFRVLRIHPPIDEHTFAAAVVDEHGIERPNKDGTFTRHVIQYPFSEAPPREGEVVRLFRDGHGIHLVGERWSVDVL